MKQTTKILSIIKRTLSLAMLAGALATASGQDSIVYRSGPSFPFGFHGAAPLDLNGDGMFDFNFSTGFMLAFCPVGTCSIPFVVVPLDGHILAQDYEATILPLVTLLPFGAHISDQIATRAWIGQWARVADYSYYNGPVVITNIINFTNRIGSIGFSDQFFTQSSSWGGPLASAGIGYLGVRFLASDGLHYGWIRVRLPTSGETFVPMVVDWAYESRTNHPIRAGVIGSGGGSQQFVVNFRGPIADLQGSTGTFILTGNILRGELTLADSFSVAEIGGPAPVHAKAKPFASLGRLGLKSFFGDVTLGHSQTIHLLRGADHVSIDDGFITGRILPVR